MSTKILNDYVVQLLIDRGITRVLKKRLFYSNGESIGIKEAVSGVVQSIADTRDSDMLMELVAHPLDSVTLQVLAEQAAEIVAESNEAKIEYGPLDIKVKNLKIFRDLNKEGKYILLDDSTKTPVDVSLDVWLPLNALTKHTLGGMVVPAAKILFNPLNPESTYVESIGVLPEVLHINTFVGPEWLKKAREFKPEEIHMPSIFARFFEHLFPDPVDREYVYCWVHHAITGRNNTALCLIGKQGTGKSKFISDIMRMLIGDKYHTVLRDADLKNNFNSSWANSRFLCFEETEMDDNIITRVKQSTNNLIALERKGVDQETIHNFNSMAITSNKTNRFDVEQAERRFSTPRPTDKPMISMFVDQEEFDAFCNMVEREHDHKDMVMLGAYFLNYEPKYNAHTPLKNAYYYEMIDYSMAQWRAGIMTEIVRDKMNIIYLTDKRNNKSGNTGFPSKNSTIANFLDSYRYRGLHQIGTLEEVVNPKKHNKLTWAIVATPEICKVVGMAQHVRLEIEDESSFEEGFKLIKNEELIKATKTEEEEEDNYDIHLFDSLE